MSGIGRTGATVAGLVLLVPGVVPVPTAASGPPVIEVSGTGAFSPNGDGVKDVARIRYTLPRRGRVLVEVREAHRRGPVVFRTRLGRQSAGRHTWRWDGRGWRGRPVPDASYAVHVISGSAQGRTGVQVDRRLRVTVSTDPTYGSRRHDPVVVHPRTRVVVDEVGLVASVVERDVVRGRLVVSDPQGRVVARTPLRRQATSRFATYDGRLAWRARDRDGRPLPPGSYAVSVSGTDLAGNRATSRPFAVRVSRRALVWREETRTVVPAQSTTHPCARTSAAGCGIVPPPCGVVVPSDRFAGGLSLRSAVCSDPARPPRAESWHLITAAEAVRGIESYRVAFSGAPTRPGEADALTVLVGDTQISSSSSAATPWLTSGPYLLGDDGDPVGIPPLRPSVIWTAATTGDDSFDVAAFTVDLRYLAVED